MGPVLAVAPDLARARGWRGAGPGCAAPRRGARRRGGPAPGPAGTGWGDLDLGRLAGSVNLTVPLATLLDLDGPPGEVAGFGPVDAGTTRALAAAAARHPATRWCVTVTDEAGRVIGQAAAAANTLPPATGPPVTLPPVALPPVAVPAAALPPAAVPPVALPAVGRGGDAACGGAAAGDGPAVTGRRAAGPC